MWHFSLIATDPQHQSKGYTSYFMKKFFEEVRRSTFGIALRLIESQVNRKGEIFGLSTGAEVNVSTLQAPDCSIVTSDSGVGIEICLHGIQRAGKNHREDSCKRVSLYLAHKTLEYLNSFHRLNDSCTLVVIARHDRGLHICYKILSTSPRPSLSKISLNGLQISGVYGASMPGALIMPLNTS